MDNYLIDETELKGEAFLDGWEDETELEEEMALWELEDADLVNDWEDEI